MHIAGLVLARGGSKGIPLKNLQKVDEKPLLVWALDAMLQCRGFQSVWVSSDHDQILDVGSSHGAKVHRRSAQTSSDQSSSLDAILEFLETRPEVDVVGLIQCTSPFVQTSDLELACHRISCGFDSVFSVRRSHSLRWTESADGATLEAANFDPSRRPKRQDWRGDLVENGAFYFSRVHLLKQGLIQGGKMSYVEMSLMSSLDIDTPYDLWLANQQVLYGGHSEPSNDRELPKKNE